jgi:hypothetical protein
MISLGNCLVPSLNCSEIQVSALQLLAISLYRLLFTTRQVPLHDVKRLPSAADEAAFGPASGNYFPESLEFLQVDPDTVRGTRVIHSQYPWNRGGGLDGVYSSRLIPFGADVWRPFGPYLTLLQSEESYVESPFAPVDFSVRPGLDAVRLLGS